MTAQDLGQDLGQQELKQQDLEQPDWAWPNSMPMQPARVPVRARV
jgi:hypothetical protein